MPIGMAIPVRDVVARSHKGANRGRMGSGVQTCKSGWCPENLRACTPDPEISLTLGLGGPGEGRTPQNPKLRPAERAGVDAAFSMRPFSVGPAGGAHQTGEQC